MPKVPHILKMLYDKDILDEEVILKWAGKPNKKHVSKSVSEELREKAKPFIKWLQEAEVEDSAESEDDDAEITYSGSQTVGLHDARNVKKDDSETEEIDIDAI